MKTPYRIIALAALLILLCGAAAVYLSRRYDEQMQRDQAQALHRAALADSAEIQRESKMYWDRGNARQQLDNDVLDWKNETLEYEIARLQGRSANRQRINRDLAIIESDKLAIRTLDPNAPALDPYQAEARIQEHNRKYPKDQMASLAKLNREMEEFHAKVRAVWEDTAKKLRQGR